MGWAPRFYNDFAKDGAGALLFAAQSRVAAAFDGLIQN
jgi:hypothetical protein